MSEQTILVVEDDPKVSSLLRKVLEGEGFAVHEAATGSAALALVRTVPLSLITLDINLGRDNGVDLVRDILGIARIPIIMVTGRDDVIDRVVGLEVGADDYITKPFHVREVIARVRSVLRRAAGPAAPDLEAAPPQAAPPAREPAAMSAQSAQFAFDGFTAVPDQLELLDRSGVDCALTSGDFKLLSVFLTHPKRVLSRDQLMDLTGGLEWSPLDRTIDNQIARLRKKIERDPSDPKLIKTVRGVGYTFASDVRITQPSASPSVSAAKSA
jgi:DNA-binding response OmpR family regulator